MDIYTASMICSIISLIVGLIGSIEMFLQIQKRMEIDLHNSKSFGVLAIDITKILNLTRENRTVDGLTFLEEKMNEYNSLVDISIVTDIQLHEKILELNLIDNLTEEEELSILSNDNLQSIFRRYKLLFLTKRRLELRDDIPDSEALTSSTKSPRRFISNLTKTNSFTNIISNNYIKRSGSGSVSGSVLNMSDADLERDIDSITRNRANSRASSIITTFVSAVRGISRTNSPNIPVQNIESTNNESQYQNNKESELNTKLYSSRHSMPPTPLTHTPFTRTPTQRRSGSRPGQTLSYQQTQQTANEFASQLKTKLESLPEVTDETESDIKDSYRDWETDRKSTRLNSSHSRASRMPSSA